MSYLEGGERRWILDSADYYLYKNVTMTLLLLLSGYHEK